jgi:hypothetical protein
VKAIDDNEQERRQSYLLKFLPNLTDDISSLPQPTMRDDPFGANQPAPDPTAASAQGFETRT